MKDVIKSSPVNAIRSIEIALEGAMWHCCDSCKHVTYDGCKLGESLGYDVIDNNVRVAEGYLCCTFWEEAE